MKNMEGSQAAAEERFIRDALANAEKAERHQKIKLVAATLAAFGGAYYAFDQPVTAQHTAFTVVITVGLMLALCTAKIMAAIATSTRAILQAVSERPRRG